MATGAAKVSMASPKTLTSDVAAGDLIAVLAGTTGVVSSIAALMETLPTMENVSLSRQANFNNLIDKISALQFLSLTT